jgi:hypothetical protein
MQAHTFRLVAAFVFAFLCLASLDLFAVTGGVVSRTLKPGSVAASCGECHGASPGNVASVVITGPTTLLAGGAGVYTVTANQTAAAAGIKMGMDVAADDAASLSATGAQTVLQGGEITHTGPNGSLHVTAGGSANYTFTYTMPAGAAVGSTHTLYAVAALSFTGWKHATNFTVTTLPANPTTLNSSNVTSASADLAWTGGGPNYRVVYKTGAVAPATPTDGTQVNLGAVTSTNISGLAANTQYTVKVYSKDAGSTIFSANGPTTTFTTLNLGAASRYVNVATGVNTGNCSVPASPCKTITYAMAQAVAGNPGDQINVAPGTYNLAAGEVFPIVFKSGIRLVSTGTPATTIIDAAGDTVKNGIINALSNNSAAARIEGFTLTNGLKAELTSCGSPLGGALYISGGTGTFTVTRNVFRANESRGYTSDGSAGQTGCLAWGGALAVFSHVVNVSNNVFVSNIARGGNGFSHPGSPKTGNENGGQGQGGAIYFAGTGTIINNTFHANAAIGGNGGITSNGPGIGSSGSGGAIMAAGNPAPSVVNNILSGNAANSGTGSTPEVSTYGAMFVNPVSPSITNNLFFGNSISSGASVGDSLGTASVALDPQFHAAPTNLLLRNTSPAKAAGTVTGAPAADHNNTARPAPPAIGAFEAASVATTTALLSGTNPSNPGQSVTFTATVTGTGGIAPGGTVTFKDGATAICSNVALASGSAQCITSALTAGAHSITAEYGPDANHTASTSSPLSQSVNNPNPPRMSNISTRMQVLTGNDVMIGGFVIGGGANKSVAIVATGPSLAAYGIANPLANPMITLVRSSDQATIATNDDWQGGCPQAGVCAAPSALTAAGFAPSNPLEAAMYITLPPGAYTAIVQGVGGGTGTAVIGVYEVDAPTTPLANISTRGRVLTGNDVMIGGFVIVGSAPQTVAIVATGPSLAPYGIANPLANPTISLVRSSDQVAIDANDDWGTHANAALLQAAGFSPNNPLESGIYTTLQPGAYTVIVSGVGGGTGVGVIGVYKVN